MAILYAVDDEHWHRICAVNNAPCQAVRIREENNLHYWRKGVEAAAKAVYGDNWSGGLACRGDELYFDRKDPNVKWLCGGVEWSPFSTPLDQLPEVSHVA